MASQHPALIEAAEGAARILDIEFLDPPSLTELALKLKISPYQLSRAFHLHHGVTMPAYVRHLKIERACALLKDPSLLVGEAALAAGYASQSAFVRAFQRETGKTPGQFRHSLLPQSAAFIHPKRAASGRIVDEE